MEVFDYAYGHSKNPLCYNGDILSVQDCQMISERYPALPAIMIGRGLIARPGFTGNGERKQAFAEKETVQKFMERLLADYRAVMSGDIHALFKMKEIWLYMAPHFTNYERYLKKIKKTNKLAEYQKTVADLFEKEELFSYSS